MGSNSTFPSDSYWRRAVIHTSQSADSSVTVMKPAFGHVCMHGLFFPSDGYIAFAALVHRTLVADNSLLERERGMGEGSIDFIMPFFLDAPDNCQWYLTLP